MSARGGKRTLTRWREGALGHRIGVLEIPDAPDAAALDQDLCLNALLRYVCPGSGWAQGAGHRPANVSDGYIRLQELNRDIGDHHLRTCEYRAESAAELLPELSAAMPMPAEHVDDVGIGGEHRGVGVNVMGVPGR